MSSLKELFLNLNLFAPTSNSNEEENAQQRRWNIIGTRIYILLIILILLIVGLMLLLSKQSVMIVIQNPTKEQFEHLPVTAKCSCSHISISYGKFISFKANFHQVCSSDFITDRWIKAINSGANSTRFPVPDFRRYGSAQFQALVAFCRLSKSNTDRNIFLFQQNKLMSQQVIQESYLRSSISATIEQFKLTAPNTFKSQLRLIDRIMISNVLISGVQTNDFYTINGGDYIMLLWYVYIQKNGLLCRCESRSCDETEAGTSNIFGNLSPNEQYRMTWIISGMSSGCLPVASLLLSTLECFYNQTCVNKLISYFSTNETFKAMIVNTESSYQPTATVKTMIGNLMNENWIMNTSYNNYYSECAPSSCTYLKVSKRGFIYTLQKLVGLLSSLTLILGIIISLVIRIIVQLQDRTPKPRTTSKLIELNIFQQSINTNRQIRFQRYATRLYLFFLIGSMIIITIYVFLQRSIHSQTIFYPTELQFIELQQEYSQSLSYGFNNISDSLSVSYAYYFEFRHISQSHFRLLGLFCEQAEQTIDDAVEIFLKREFVSSQVLPQQSFQIQINSSIEDWKFTMINTFKRTIQLIQRINEGNQLISRDLNIRPKMNRYSTNIISNVITHFKCNCILSPTCYTNAEIIHLEHTVHKHLRSPNNFSFSSLNPNLNLYSETMEMLVNRLMVDRWLSDVSYSSYYKICLPLSCTYQYEDRNHIFISITTIISIFGGLSLVLKLFLTFGLKFIDKILTNNMFHSISLNSIKQIFICHDENDIIHRLHIILVITSLKIYKDLFQQSYETLECSCSQLSIKYKIFLNLTTRFHEICSSDFVTNRWISYLYKKKVTDYENDLYDFYYSAVGQFQLLSSICNLSNETVYNSIFQLGTTDFINNQLLSSDLLVNQIQLLINEFEQTMSQSFINTISLIRELTHANMLMNGFFTNWQFDLTRLSKDYIVANIVPVNYSGCSCSLASKCVISSRNMLTGCYPLESILQTILQCFYNQECIDSTNTFHAINISSLFNSRFSLNQTIETLVDKLMIEQLIYKINYTKYFYECSPSLCIYSYIDKTNLIQGITIFIGLYGGLVIICRLIAVLITKQICHSIQRINPT
ncbi:hypothetical protein I4U23_022514 [Adineta vaga]|nr:hypothetical protein I4U23_022514 [Adineta vaga]